MKRGYSERKSFTRCGTVAIGLFAPEIAAYNDPTRLQDDASLAIPESRRLAFTEVPVIDVGDLMRGGDNAQTIESIRNACRDVGFLYVSNHGVPDSTVQALVSAADEFFEQPVDDKMRVALDQRMRGYLPLYYRSYEGEDRAATSHQEGFWIGHERPLNPQAPLEGPNVWPEDQPELKRAMLEYFYAIDPLRLTLQRAFSLALGLAPATFDELFDHSLSRLKLNHTVTGLVRHPLPTPWSSISVRSCSSGLMENFRQRRTA